MAAKSKGHTLISLFEKAQSLHAEEECYISFDGNMERRSITFREIWVLASRFAYNLKQHGLQRGDYVVIATPSTIEYIVANFGIIFAGGVTVPMDKFFPECQLIKETIKLTQAKIMLLTDSSENDTWPFFEPKSVDENGDNNAVGYKDDSLPSLKKIVFVNKTPGRQNSVSFLDHLRTCQNEFRDTDLDPEDGCVCVASLNTGLATPKLCEFSHRSLVNTTRLWTKISAEFGKIYTRLPWYIVACLPYDALNGLPRSIFDNSSKMSMTMGEHYINVFETEGMHGGLMGPSDVKEIADAHKESDKTLLKHLFVGGQPMTRTAFEITQKVSSYTHIVYISSETNLVSMNRVTPEDTFIPLDSGFPLDGVEVRILDDQLKELPRGTTGRIAVRSPYMFTRYPGLPELSKSVWGPDGWFYTEDAGCLSTDGHVHVFGRRGDVISRGIILTYPSWIEKPIMDIPDVLQVMAVPIPDEINYNNICACVVLCPGSKLTEKDIHKLYTDSMSGEGVDTFPLDHVLIFQGCLPRLSRQQLGDMATEKLGLPPRRK